MDHLPLGRDTLLTARAFRAGCEMNEVDVPLQLKDGKAVHVFPSVAEVETAAMLVIGA